MRIGTVKIHFNQRKRKEMKTMERTMIEMLRVYVNQLNDEEMLTAAGLGTAAAAADPLALAQSLLFLAEGAALVGVGVFFTAVGATLHSHRETSFVCFT